MLSDAGGPGEGDGVERCVRRGRLRCAMAHLLLLLLARGRSRSLRFSTTTTWHVVAFTGCEIEVVLTREGVDGDTTCG